LAKKSNVDAESEELVFHRWPSGLW